MDRNTLLRRLAASVAAATLGAGSAFAITVVAETPLDLEKTVPQTVISKEMILQLPTSRDVGEILTMTPGLPGPGPVESVPGVETIRYRLEGSSSAPTFPPGTTVDFGDGKALHFPSMYTFRFNAPADGMRIVVRRPDRKKPLVDEPVRIPAVQLRDFGTIVAPNRFETPPVAVAGRISVVRGSLSGDGAKTKVSIGGKPVRIIAENARSVFFAVPDDVPAGYAKVTIDDGGRTAEIPIAILTLSMSADQLKLKRGQTTKFHVTISGPESWDDSAWKSAIPWDLCDVDALRAKFRDFQPPAPGSDGFLLFSVTNMSPRVISMQEFARRLGKADFKSGSYSYDGAIGAVNDGGFGIHGEVEAFVAPASAEVSGGK
ncbi:MAG TPA: hypothetical protein VG777_06800 [Thermoanaerobaculia bacterium]|nr:hypothetical protein [Thermoanaerobaculia bacterium]